MLSRFTVAICVSMAVVGDNVRFSSGRPRDIGIVDCQHRLRILDANYCNLYTTVIERASTQRLVLPA